MVKSKMEERVGTVLKKGYELETLCGSDVSVVIRDPLSGRIFKYPDDISQILRINNRYNRRPKKPKAKNKKKMMKLSHDPQIQVSQLPLSGPGSSSSSQDTLDLELIPIPEFEFEDPELWYCDNSDGFDPNGIGIDIGGGVDHQPEPELGVMGFGEIEGQVEEDQSQIIEMEYDPDFNLEEFWNGIPQLDPVFL